MSSDVELGLSWLSLTSRDSSVTVSPLWIDSAGSFPASHLKWTWAVLVGFVAGVAVHLFLFQELFAN